MPKSKRGQDTRIANVPRTNLILCRLKFALGVTNYCKMTYFIPPLGFSPEQIVRREPNSMLNSILLHSMLNSISDSSWKHCAYVSHNSVDFFSKIISITYYVRIRIFIIFLRFFNFMLNYDFYL
jgi:hypothetical protein